MGWHVEMQAKKGGYLRQCMVWLLVMTAPFPLIAQERTADELMRESAVRHQSFPFVYEEQTMILMEENRQRTTRKLRNFSRMEEDGELLNMLLFDQPEEIHGVAVLTKGKAEGERRSQLYLPAYGQQLINSNLTGQALQLSGARFLGTDFMVSDLLPEMVDDYSYRRLHDQMLDEVEYWVIEATPLANHTLATKRHLYLRKDNYFIVRVDTFNHLGQRVRQKSAHDLKSLGNGLWVANMILMNDLGNRHQTLIKIDRRVFSRDYVPHHLFTLQWLSENQGAPLNDEKALPWNQTEEPL